MPTCAHPLGPNPGTSGDRVPHLALKMEGSSNTDLGCHFDSCFLAHLEMQDEDAGISVGLVRSGKSQIGPITLGWAAS